MFSFLNPHTSLAHSGLLQGAADHHTHILYGVDDGVKTLEGALRILDWEAAHGVTEVWCTPHIMEDVPNRTEDLRKRFQELTNAYKGPIRLHLAAEYMLDNLYLERLKNRDLLLHGQDRILVETSTGIPPYNLWDILEQTLSAGYRPILAHAERYHYLHQEDYDRLINMGVRMQLNLPSLAHYYGTEVKNRADWLLKKGYYCMTGSDVHRLKTLLHQFGSKAVRKRTLPLVRPIMPPYTED